MTEDGSVETTDHSDVERPVGVNHLVLNVYDIEESHRFWTAVIGFRHVGALRPRKDREKRPALRFYSGDHGGKLAHHDGAMADDIDNAPRCPASVA